MLQKHEYPVEKSVSSSSHRLQRRLTEPMGQGVFFFRVELYRFIRCQTDGSNRLQQLNCYCKWRAVSGVTSTVTIVLRLDSDPELT